MDTTDTTPVTAAPPAARYGLPGCINCGPVELYPVFDGEVTNFYCDLCGTCWHFTLGFMVPVDPKTCPGCQIELQCRERQGAHSLT